MEGIEMSECEYPDCKVTVMFTLKDGRCFCREHYGLFKFIDDLLFRATIELDIRRDKYAKEPSQ
jgi:hypothetical protein